MTGRRVALKVLAVVLLVALVAVPLVAARTITTNGANVFVGEEDPSETYSAVAKWPSISDFYDKGFDSKSVTFEVAAPPTALPTAPPTTLPTTLPTALPTTLPTALPTTLPTALPTTLPTALPTTLPTALPTAPPTTLPTTLPTALPTAPPTALPTPLPRLSGGSGSSTSSGSLDISSTPSGASIYTDGTYKGVTPGIISGLSAGSHQVAIRKSGYYDYTLTTTVIAGKTTGITAILTALPPAAMPTPTTGDLDIRSTPSGANVYVDSMYKDVTPAVVSGLSEGSHQIKLTKSGYYDYTQTTSVTAGKTTTVSATLSPALKILTTGSLDFKSAPSGANIYIDSIYMGVTPVVVSELPEGSYQIRLAKSGYDDYTRTASVTAGGTTTISATLISKLIYPIEPPSIAALSGVSPTGEPFTTLWWLPVVAIVLLVGGFIYARKRRSAQAGGSGIDTAQSPDSPAGQGATTPPGRADVLVQKSSSFSSKGPDSGVVLPDEGFTPSIAKPDLTITLSHTTIYTDEWDKIGLTLANTGTAPALGIILTFSDDVETRLLRPVDLAVGESTTIEAGIRPRAKGNIPLEITARYRDAGNRTYDQTTSCWLLVVSRNDSPGSPLPSPTPHPMASTNLPAEVVDRYIASEYLGSGGFARVFKVQKPDGSWAALKIPISLDAATGRSFIAELQNWTSLAHENIVRVNDYNIMPLPYFELELCDGTLAALERPVPPDHAAWLLFNVCEGLKYAHARGVLHRDLKPQNIMLRDGVPKITDWGLSKVMTQSRTTTVSGGFTAYYAAPEQIANRAKGPRTDIWQLGVILYELATGRLPFAGESMVEIGMAIVTKTPERPGAVHPGAQPLDTIVLKCLEKQPKQRYQSVADLQKDLAVYLKLNYTESLKESIQAKNFHRSAYYCGDLVLVSMKIGDLVAAYKYAIDLARYSAGEARVQAIDLVRQIKARVEMGAQELPDELIQKAEVIVHQVRMQ